MSHRDEILGTLRAALPDLRRGWPIRSLAVFGSLARDEAGPASDVDILVEFDKPPTLSDFLKLEERLSALAGRRVELVSRRSLKPYIGRQILREAVPVYAPVGSSRMG